MIKVQLKKVTAIDPCKMRVSGAETLRVGKVYEVLSMGDGSITILDEQDERHTFTNKEAGKHIFKSDFLEVTNCVFLEASGRVRLTDEGLEYFISWFCKGGKAESAARKRHLSGEGFKIVEKGGSSIKIKCKNEMWWVNAQKLDFRDITLVKE